MTRDDLSDVSREDLIDRLLDADQQLRWFKQQLFGAKSERRTDLVPDPSQLSLGEALAQAREPEAPTTTVPAHVRRKPASREDSADSGLRFDDSVPITRIVIENSELEGVADEDVIQIDERITHQLAQRPASYHVIEYVRRVVKRRDTNQISCPPAPTSVLEKSYADVSLLAGMLIDKFRYHLPLYRQHQRMQAAGSR